MKSILASLVLVGSILPAAAADLPVRPEELPPPEEITFSPPEPIRETLPNGLRLIMLPEKRIPLVTLKAVTLAGSVCDPPGRAGLARLVGECIVTGGSEATPPGEFAEILESLGTDFTSSVRREEAVLTMNLLSRDLDRGLGLFAEVLRYPRLSEEILQVNRGTLLGEVARTRENPEFLGKQEFKRVLYGTDSPWASPPTEISLGSIAREDLQAFHGARFGPSKVILAVSGDFDPALLAKKVGELFGDWKDLGVEAPPSPAAPDESPAGLYLIDRPDLDQTTFLMGELICPRTVKGVFNEDRYPLDLLNFRLGGSSFSSVIMQEIRSSRGPGDSARCGTQCYGSE